MLVQLQYFLKDFSLYLVINLAGFTLLVLILFVIYKSKTSEKKKKIFFALTLNLFLIIVTFSFFEAYFRYIYDQSDGLGFLQVNKKWHQRHVVYNNYFFRDRNFELQKPEGYTRIGILGDSITFGAGIKNVEDRFSNKLEKNLNQEGRKVEVYNLGKSGTDTPDQFKELQKVDHLNFDMLVLAYFLNDAHLENQTKAAMIIDKGGKKAKAVKFTSEKSYFFDFLFWRFSSRYQTTFEELKNSDLNQYKDPEIVRLHKEQLSTLIKSQQEKNRKVVVIIFPFTHLLGPNYPAKEIHNEMSQFFKSQGVGTIDLITYLEYKNGTNLQASKFDTHPNEIVHDIAARLLTQKILPLLQNQ